MYATADLLFSPVFHRRPRLKVGLSEGGIGWVPYLLERIDGTWERHRFHQNVNQNARPSELFARHLHGCFIDDTVGVKVPQTRTGPKAAPTPSRCCSGHDFVPDPSGRVPGWRSFISFHWEALVTANHWLGR